MKKLIVSALVPTLITQLLLAADDEVDNGSWRKCYGLRD